MQQIKTREKNENNGVKVKDLWNKKYLNRA